MTERKTDQSRRAFLRTAGKVAVAAPAVALLLSAQGKGALAGVPPINDPYGSNNLQ